MPRGKLNEAYVKQTAVEWLANSYYRNSLDANAIVSGVEAWVSKNNRRGNGRADGLIAAQLCDGSIYTISIEAKSSRTWNSISVYQDHLKILFHVVVFAVLITVVLAILGIFPSKEIFQGIILPSLAIAVIGYCLVYFSPLNIRYREAKVVRQAERYPANEKWIALSADIYNRLVNENQSFHFERICQKSGIGLIRVTSSTKIKVVVAPRAIPTPKNLESFLSCYSRSEIVRGKLVLALREPNIDIEPLLLDEPERTSLELASEEIAESVLNAETQEESSVDEAVS